MPEYILYTSQCLEVWDLQFWSYCRMWVRRWNRVDRSSMLRTLKVCQQNSIAVSRQTSKRTLPKALKFARFRVRTPIKRESIKAERTVTIILQAPASATTLSIVNKLFMVRNLEKKLKTTILFITSQQPILNLESTIFFLFTFSW